MPVGGFHLPAAGSTHPTSWGRAKATTPIPGINAGPSASNGVTGAGRIVASVTGGAYALKKIKDFRKLSLLGEVIWANACPRRSEGTIPDQAWEGNGHVQCYNKGMR